MINMFLTDSHIDYYAKKDKKYTFEILNPKSTGSVVNYNRIDDEGNSLPFMCSIIPEYDGDSYKKTHLNIGGNEITKKRWGIIDKKLTMSDVIEELHNYCGDENNDFFKNAQNDIRHLFREENRLSDIEEETESGMSAEIDLGIPIPSGKTKASLKHKKTKRLKGNK